jgi:hypothetical protein
LLAVQKIDAQMTQPRLEEILLGVVLHEGVLCGRLTCRIEEE